MDTKSLIIMGVRGIPAAHGGFETFAEKLALYLIQQDWSVTVYCQESMGNNVYESEWHGIKRIHIPVKQEGAWGTMVFDYKAIKHSLTQPGLVLTLGYNTAIFNTLHSMKKRMNVINMDGIEWKREKWGAVARTWFWLNERIGCHVGSHLIADHPKIKEHLATRVKEKKITMIPYGADEDIDSDIAELKNFNIESESYSVLIARPEPENSVYEIVKAFSKKKRDHKLLVLGKYTDKNPYHCKVKAVASEEVNFVGAIYNSLIVNTLRKYARFYLHGHQVGGTNPSLVEALGAGNAVIAHDNMFNRWVAGNESLYFKNVEHLDHIFNVYLKNDKKIAFMREASKTYFLENFTWPKVLNDYDLLLTEWYDFACAQGAISAKHNA